MIFQKMQKIYDFFASAGLFQKENLSLPEGSPVDTGQVIQKIMDFFHFPWKKN